MRGGSAVVGSPLTEEQLAEELKELELELAEESGGLEEVGGSAAHLVEQHPYTEAVREENRQKRQQATAEKQQERKAVSALKKEEQQGEKEKENIENFQQLVTDNKWRVPTKGEAADKGSGEAIIGKTILGFQKITQ